MRSGGGSVGGHVLVKAQAAQIAERFDGSRFSEILGVGAGDGTVLATILEPVRGRGAGTAMDTFMLMCFSGRERTVDGLAADRGLTLLGSDQVAEGRTALELGLAPHRVDEPG